MKKKIILLFFLILTLSGCKIYNLNTLSFDESVNVALNENINLYNVNNIGYRYYLPRGYSLKEDRENIQVIESNGVKLYLNVDLISYYNKTLLTVGKSENAYKSYSFGTKDNPGYVEVIKNEENLIVKMVYNYAIIEAEILEKDLQKTVMNMTYILSSIKYNDSVLNNKFGEDALVFNETTYEIFGPKQKEDTKTYAYYLENYEAYEGPIEDKVKDPDVIGD